MRTLNSLFFKERDISKGSKFLFVALYNKYKNFQIPRVNARTLHKVSRTLKNGSKITKNAEFNL